MSLQSGQMRELELSIADQIYIQVEKWHLYLGDAGLSKPLAIECQANLDNGSRIAAKKACNSVQVQLGGGQTRLPLSQLISSAQILDLEEILDDFCS